MEAGAIAAFPPSCPADVFRSDFLFRVLCRAVAPQRACCAAPSGSRARSDASPSPDDFRHPLDRENTRLLRALPGLDSLARSLLSSTAEQLLVLENVGSAVRVSERQLPTLHRAISRAASVLGLERAPDLYVKQAPSPNAYTLAVGGRAPFVVVHTALLELLSEEEVVAVLAHECAHIRCEHGVYLTLANVLADGAASAPGLGALLRGGMEDALARWLRAAELTCDRAALLVVGEPRVVVSALMKLAGGSPSLATELDPDAFLQQARLLDEASATPLGWWLRNAATRQLSHPLPVLRAREVDTWASSGEYQRVAQAYAARQPGANASEDGRSSGDAQSGGPADLAAAI